MANRPSRKEDSSSIYDQLELISDRFDRSWSSGSPPSLAEYLEEVDGRNRNMLLELLVPIDIEYRIRVDIAVHSEDYKPYGRFAEKIAKNELVDQTKADSSFGTETDFPLIKGYEFLREIGSGGMGRVFLANQKTPVKRQVAVKIIHVGYDSRELISRFEGERQALAFMAHPNIAKIFDAGTSESGMPFFTMEWVQGKQIASYCDEYMLGIDERIWLFVQVCSAVQHAHQKGIIHRDLKPSNILVANADGAPSPKVIDFGLAKALNEQNQLSDHGSKTRIGAIVGTPRYMSPEQAEGNVHALDTRTDIYSLGVILYELLTGTTPLELEKVDSSGPLKALEMLRNNDVQRPSSRISSANELTGPVSVSGKKSVSRLKKLLRRELDWIVLKALERKPEWRYETVESFKNDLERFLNNEPVKARPPSFWYTCRKTAQKHKVLLSTAVLFLALFVTASLIIFNQYIKERSARLETETKIARAKFFGAHGLFNQDRAFEAIQMLESIDPEHRHIEYWLAKKQFGGNSFDINDGQTDNNFTASLSENGELIASAGDKRKITIRSAMSGKVIRYIGAEIPNDVVYSIRIHPSKPLVALGRDGYIQIWNYENDKLIQDFDFQNVPVRALQFSPNGKLLAAAGGTETNKDLPNQNHSIRVWQLDYPDQNPTVLTGHDFCINQISFCKDDSRLISCSWDKTVRFWNVHSGKEIDRKEIGTIAMSVTCDRNGKFVACGIANNQVRLWQIAADKLIHYQTLSPVGYEGNSIRSIAFDQETEFLAIAGFDRTIRIWDVATGNERMKIRGHLNELACVEFIPNSRKLFSASVDGTIKIFDIDRLSESRTLTGHGQSVTSLDFSSDSDWLLSAGGDHQFDIDEGAPSNTKNRSVDNNILLWNTRNSAPPNFFVGHQQTVNDVKFIPDDINRFVSCSNDGRILFWERGQVGPIAEIENAHQGLPVHKIAFHPKGKKFASVGGDGETKIWDVASQAELHAFTKFDIPAQFVTWSQDGTMVAAGGNERNKAQFKIWNIQSNTLMMRVNYDSAIQAMKFSTDQSTLIVAGERLGAYNLATHEPIPIPKHTRLGLYFVDVSNDSNDPRIIIGGREGQVWLWDSETWEELLALKIKNWDFDWNFVYDGKFSPDGTMIATANRDGTIRIWDAPPFQN